MRAHTAVPCTVHVAVAVTSRDASRALRIVLVLCWLQLSLHPWTHAPVVEGHLVQKYLPDIGIFGLAFASKDTPNLAIDLVCQAEHATWLKTECAKRLTWDPDMAAVFDMRNLFTVATQDTFAHPDQHAKCHSTEHGWRCGMHCTPAMFPTQTNVA